MFVKGRPFILATACAVALALVLVFAPGATAASRPAAPNTRITLNEVVLGPTGQAPTADDYALAGLDANNNQAFNLVLFDQSAEATYNVIAYRDQPVILDDLPANATYTLTALAPQHFKADSITLVSEAFAGDFAAGDARSCTITLQAGSELELTFTNRIAPAGFGNAVVASNYYKLPTPPPVINETPDSAIDRILPPIKSGDTVDWIEIARNGKYSLIVRSKYINFYSSNYDNLNFIYTSYGPGSPPSNAYGSSYVRSNINSWYNGAASGTADRLPSGAALRQYAMQNNATSVLGTTYAVGTGGGLTDGFSKPSNTYASTLSNTDDVAFALSFTESANFLSVFHASTGGGSTTPSAPDAITNFNRLTPLPAGGYGMWLRSPGSLATTAGILTQTGEAYQFNTASSSGQRGLIYPALWVDSAIFK